MTNREFLDNVINGTITDEVVAYAENAKAQLDVQNAKRREKTAEKTAAREAERAPIREAIVAVITNEPKTATMLIEDANVDITPQAIPSLLKGLVEAGTIVKTKLKIQGKAPAVAYVLPAAETVDAE